MIIPDSQSPPVGAMTELMDQMKMSESTTAVMGVTNGGNDGFVTVVQVSNSNVDSKPNKVEEETDPNAGNFVTVVELEPNSTSSQQPSEGIASCDMGGEGQLTCRQEVVMYRLPCERLGMGLKFDGGMQATECVRHVYIQSVAPDSPAQRTQTAWNGLEEGDEILKIDGRSVVEMTRVETVNTLKKAPVAIKLFVQHVYRCPTKVNQPGLRPGQYLEMSSPLVSTPRMIPELPPSPPPVPPRKMRPRKSSSSSAPSSPPTPPPRQMDLLMEHNLRNLNLTMRQLPAAVQVEEMEELILEEELNVEDELTLDRRNEYESDDTGSTTSTVVERMNNNSVTNNVYFLVNERKPLDIGQALIPFEQLEKEIENETVVVNGVTKPIEPPDKFKDLYHYEAMESVAVEPMESRPPPTTEEKQEGDVSPPPIPPRKSKLAKSHSYDGHNRARQTNHFTTPSDDWPEDDVTLSIVGNLLQELEQLPEFSRPNARNNSRVNLSEEISWSKSVHPPPPPVSAASAAANQSSTDSDAIAVDNSQVNSVVNCVGADETSSSADVDWTFGCESSSEVNLLEVNGESVSIPAPDLFDDRSSVKGISEESDKEEEEGRKGLEEGEEPSKHAKAVATSLTSSQPQDQSPAAAAAIAAATDQQQTTESTCSDQSCSSVMANEVIYSPCSLRNFSDSEAFLPVFSRLPPDGHEFPSNYMENDDSLFRFCAVEKPTEEFAPLATQLEKNLLEPPAGFEDTSLAKLSNMKAGDNRFVTGDYSAILNISESLGYEDDDEDDDEDELPPPPPMSPPQHQQLLYEIVNEPIEFEEYDDDDDEEDEEELMLRNNSLSDIDKCSPPPIPPKRLSSTTSSSSSSTEKTVIAASSATVVSPTKSTSSKETKTGNESMSVRDKIALFTAKVEQESFPPSKPVKTLLRSVSEPTKVKDQEENAFISLVDDDEDDEEDDDDEDEDEEDPVTAIETSSVNINKCPADNLIFNYPSMDSEPNLYQDRPSSSLSVSSNFSKSSDDILGQDVDSSDVDDHQLHHHHHQLPQGSSLSLDRRSFYPPKSYEANRYSLDFSSNQLDSSLLKATSGGNKTVEGGGTKGQSMYAILESRKNTVSKLKGLVIPQIKKSSQQTVTAPVVPDLPLIYSVDSIIKPLTPNRSATETKSDGEESKAELKSPSSKLNGKMTSNDPPIWLEPPPPLPKSLPPLLETSVPLPVHSPPQLDHELDDRLDTEDQESGISSIDSPNVSIHNTPPASPKEKPHRRHHHHHHHHHHPHHMKHHSDQTQVEEEEDAVADDDVTTSSGSNSAAMRKNSSDNSQLNWDSTDDSEASSSSDMRVLKANSVEAINRKNVLQSSRNSCGGGNNDQVDAKIKLYSDATKQPTSTVQKLNERRSSDERPLASTDFASIDSSDGSSACGDVDTQAKRGVDQSKRNAPVSDERWLELERKYGNKPQESTVVKKLDKVSRGSTLPLQGKKREDNGSHIGFKALAETWKQRASTVDTEAPSKSTQKLSKVIPNGTPANVASSRQVFEETTVAENGNKSLVVEAKTVVSSDKRSSSLGHELRPMAPPPPPPPMSNNSTNNQVVHRERPNRASTGSVSRPTSLIETDSINLKLWPGVSFVEQDRKSQVVSRSAALVLDSRAKRRGPVDGHHSISTYNKSNRSTSVNDLRQMFESPTSASVPHKKLVNRLAEPNNRRMVRDNSSHIRMSSLDSTASESEPGTPGHYGSATSLGSSPAIDHYGSITSLASSTSLISPQELQQLIDEANQSLEESGTPSHEITVVVLQREIAGGSIGITLAGGADYDSKEITVNKVIAGSLADRDGRILKGDRVLSINGKNLKGLTHREALCILKAPRSDCVLVLSRNKASSGPPDVVKDVVGNGLISRSPNKSLPPRNSLNSRLNPPSAVICTKPEIAFCPADNLSVPSSNSTSTVITTQIIKDSSGLGFSLDGGKDSPLGDRPITIKKIFNGTAADKNKDLHVGDEILSINGIDVTNMNRIAAWSIMKKLANGTVSLVVNQKR